MFRALVILIPVVACVGTTVIALRVPAMGSEEEHFRKLVAGALAAGLVFSGITAWQEIWTESQNSKDRDILAERVATDTTGMVTEGLRQQYEDKIRSLTGEVAGLQARLGNQAQNMQVSQTEGAGNNPGAKSPKLYWTQQNYTREDGSSGESVIRFKVYGPLNVPAFVAICDRPCRATRGAAGAGSEGTQLVGNGSKNVAGFIFSKPRPMAAGSEGYIIVAPSSAAVTEFRILGEPEIPAGMR